MNCIGKSNTGGDVYALSKAAYSFDDFAKMTNAQIKQAYRKLRAEGEKLTDQMIAEGRGHERLSDYASKTDPLSVRLREIGDSLSRLMYEVENYRGTRNVDALGPGGARTR